MDNVILTTVGSGARWLLRIDVVLVAVFVVLITSATIKLVKLLQQMRAHSRVVEKIGSVPPHWLFGHLLVLGGNEEGMTNQGELATKNVYCYKFWAGPFTCVVNLTHPESVKRLSNTTEPKNEFVYGMLRPWLGDGLLISKGQKWFRNRRLLTPAFHYDILKPYADVFGETAKVMLDKWETLNQDESVEISEQVSLMTLDGLMKCIFSYHSNCQTAGRDQYIQQVYLLSHLIEKRFSFPPYLSDGIFYNSYHGYQFKKACNFVHEKARHVIKERRKHLDEEQDGKVQQQQHRRKYLDFLDILLATKDEDGNGLTDAEIRDEVDTFMFEGHDTTASGISWCLYNLARHPEYQQKCRQEIDELMDNKGTNTLHWDDLSKMPYTTMCIKESLRLHPPVPWIGRVLTKPLVLQDGIVVPEDHIVGINISACHHNANVWPNPNVYDPERFSPQNSKDRSSHAFIPFSAGPRNCIGQNFAMNELKVSVAMTIRRFVLTVDEEKPVSRMTEVVLRSSTGIHLFVKAR
ncbi:cytochrome P450 4F4-like [Glandiceps talaboti]